MTAAVALIGVALVTHLPDGAMYEHVVTWNQLAWHPDQALLRYRAYRPARSESDNTVSIEPHANIKA